MLFAVINRGVCLKVFVVLPAYNEAEALPPLTQSIHAILSESGKDFRIVIVNDGSKDGTLALAQQLSTQYPIDVLDNGVNRGLATTLQNGLQHAIKKCGPDDVIITMDADNTQPTGLMPRMISAIREGNDVVVASRYREGSSIHGLTMWRRFLSYGASWLFRITFSTHGVRDFTCGFRAYRAQVLQDLNKKSGGELISATGFSCMVDLLLKLRSQGAIFCEVPMVLRYDRKPGVSKMKVLSTVFETLTLVVRRRLGLHRVRSSKV